MQVYGTYMQFLTQSKTYSSFHPAPTLCSTFYNTVQVLRCLIHIVVSVWAVVDRVVELKSMYKGACATRLGKWPRVPGTKLIKATEYSRSDCMVMLRVCQGRSIIWIYAANPNSLVAEPPVPVPGCVLCRLFPFTQLCQIMRYRLDGRTCETSIR